MESVQWLQSQIEKCEQKATEQYKLQNSIIDEKL
jgi:hypothetical protein